MKAIAAMSENRAIGNKGTIPWKNTDALKWFEEFTSGKTILVGGKTYNLLPFLPKRKVLVLTNSEEDISYWEPVEDYSVAAVSLGKAQIVAKRHEIIVAGGAQVYSLFMPQISEFYVTHIEGVYKGDIFMPAFEPLFSQSEVIREFKGGKVVKYFNGSV